MNVYQNCFKEEIEFLVGFGGDGKIKQNGGFFHFEMSLWDIEEYMKIVDEVDSFS